MKLKYLDKVKIVGTSQTGTIVQRSFKSRDRTFDYAVDLSKAGMPFIAGFNKDELEKLPN